jgi:uncharacterized protein
MRLDAIKKAVDLAERIKSVLIATANRKGEPHLAAAAQLTQIDGNRVAVSAWFCPMTVANLHENHRVSLVVWDSKTDTGYQLAGKSEKVEELAMLDGYAPKMDEKITVPQVERRVIVKIEKIIAFKHAPHNDLEE